MSTSDSMEVESVGFESTGGIHIDKATSAVTHNNIMDRIKGNLFLREGLLPNMKHIWPKTLSRSGNMTTTLYYNKTPQINFVWVINTSSIYSSLKINWWHLWKNWRSVNDELRIFHKPPITDIVMLTTLVRFYLNTKLMEYPIGCNLNDIYFLHQQSLCKFLFNNSTILWI